LQGHAVRDTGALGDAREVDALGVDVEFTPGLFDGAKEILRQLGVVLAGFAPSVGSQAVVVAEVELYRASQTQVQTVSAADSRGKSQDRLVVSTVRVEEDD
jgi:hypothetical protein